METENIMIDDAIRHFERLYDQGYGWMKEISEIQDGLNKIEREVIRSLLKNGGSLSAGILIGEVISRLVYVNLDEIKREVLKMLNQHYPLIKREFTFGKPYFTSEKIELTELGYMLEDRGDYYLKSYLPLYFLQEKIKEWDDIKLCSLSFQLNSFLNYIQFYLTQSDSLTEFIKFKLPRRTKIQNDISIVKELNDSGKVGVDILGSVEYKKFLNELILYSTPVGKGIEDVIDYFNENGQEVIGIDWDSELKINVKLNEAIDEEKVKQFLSDLGYDQHIEHSYYLIDENGDLCIGSFSYLMEYWLSSIEKDRDIVLSKISNLLKSLNSTGQIEASEDEEVIRVWDVSNEKWVLVNEIGKLSLEDSLNDCSYGFKIKNEDVVVITENSHLRTNVNKLVSLVSNLNNDNSKNRFVGAFPICDEIKEDRIYYFINQKGFVKASSEKDIYSKSSKVNSTEVLPDERLVKILVNDEGKDNGHILFITKKGYIKVLHVSEIKPKNRASKYVLGLRLAEDDYVYKAFMLKDDFSELHLKLSNSETEKELSFKDYDIVTSKLNRGTLIKDISDIDNVEILNKDIISDSVFI